MLLYLSFITGQSNFPRQKKKWTVKNVMFLTQQHKTSKLSTLNKNFLSARVRNSAEVSYYAL